jgi:Ni,Fe-hydrogenase III component G
MSNKREKVVKRLMKRITDMLAECEQAIRDCDYWNAIHPDDFPIDAEWFKVQAAGCRKTLAAIERGEPIDASWIQWK